MEKPLFVRQNDVPLRWHEVVALVRGVTDALDDGRLRSVPAPGELALESDGSIHLTQRAALAALDRGQVVTQLRGLLGELLSSDAPPQLRAIAEPGEGGPPVTTLAGFRQAIAFFERPTHESDRRALAARLSQIEEEHQLETEVERLRRKARDEDKAPAERAIPPVVRRKSLRKALVAVAVVLGVGAGVAMGMFTAPVAVGGDSSPASEDAGGKGENGIVGKLLAAAGSALGTSAPREPQPAPAEKPAPEPRGSRPTRRPAASPRPQPVARATAGVPLTSSLSDLRLLIPTRVPFWTSPELTVPQSFGSIFSRGDFDVDPPVLVRPHLPTVGSIGIPGELLGAVDVIVAEDGRVEQVRLVRTTAERRYHDIMILAAVKAWVFRPASRSGQTVRYRLQIPLT